MAIYVLKNLVTPDFISKYHAFSLEWMRWFRFAQFAPKDMEFSDGDIVIVNIFNGDPFSGYTIPENVKKIFILHDCNMNTIPVLRHAHCVIFMNKLQEDIVTNISGYVGKREVAVRFPLKQFPLELPKENSVYIGGHYDVNKMKGFTSKLEELFTLVSRDTKVNCKFIVGESQEVKNDFTGFRNDLIKIPQFLNRLTIEASDKIPYEKMHLNLRTSKHAFLWSTSPKSDFISDLVNSKDSAVLSYNVSESAMLSHAQSAGCNILLENRINFLPFFQKLLNYSYKDFSNTVLEAISKI